MSLLNTIAPDQAQGEIADIYNDVSLIFGSVPNGLILHSLNPLRMRQIWEYMGSVMQHPSLSSDLFTFIRLLVSVDQRCQYCIDMNAGMLIQQSGIDVATIQAAQNDPTQAPLNDKEKYLLLLALKAAKTSNQVDASDIQGARDLGASDSEVYDVVCHAASQVMGDILLNTFKVENDY